MKKVSTLILILGSFFGLFAQNDETSVQPPQGVVAVPGTADLYTTPYDEVSRMLRPAAVSACGCKGEGWRLPTLGELQIMYSHRYEMDFADGWYWTGEKVRGEFRFYDLNFKNGKIRAASYNKEDFVRCVWSSKPANVPASNLQPMAQQSNPAVKPPVSPTSQPAPAEKAKTDTSKNSTSSPTPSNAPRPQPTATAPQPQPQPNGRVMDDKDVTKPYRSSFGLVAGSLNGLSLKVFPSTKFAVIMELGVKVTAASGTQLYEMYNWNNYYNNFTYQWESYGYFTTPYTLEFDVNFVHQDHFVAGLYGLAGGGLSLGWHFRNSYPYYLYESYTSQWPRYRQGNGKAGVNLIFGLEYIFEIPIALQVDFRPGYGLLFASGYTAHYFDWGLNLGFRYAFK